MMGFRAWRESRRALDVAWDCGIDRFDLARSYGYGQAEALFRGFARGRRHRIFIATKFGIDPDPSLKANAIRLLRGGTAGLRHLRWPFSRCEDRENPLSPHWSAARLRASLERSLRELGTDWIDFLWLHSPPQGIVRNEALFAELDRLASSGLIRGYGLSTGADRGARELAELPWAIGAIQHPFCPLTGDTAKIDLPSVQIVVNHIFGGRGTLANGARLITGLRNDQAIPPELREKLGEDGAGATLADILLNGALAASSAQYAVVSMFQPVHIAMNAQRAGNSRFTPEELKMLVSALSMSGSSERQ